MTINNAPRSDIYIKTSWGGISSFSEEQIETLVAEIQNATISDRTGLSDAEFCECEKGVEVNVAKSKKSIVIAIAKRLGFDDATVQHYIS